MVHRHRALNALGLNVRKIREAKRLTQERLAEKADLDLPEGNMNETLGVGRSNHTDGHRYRVRNPESLVQISFRPHR